jgi:hypothetical protein
VLDDEEFIPEIGHFDPVTFLNCEILVQVLILLL